ncbi:MAG: DUF2974 domain-containing protein [Clostridiales bacterium]|nr:DUF2974 domain-containing protein [Clostridiales bacterium]
MSERKKAEKSLLDYVKTNTHSFDEMPFNNADGLVFAQAANMRFEHSGIDFVGTGAKPFAQIYKDMQDGLTHAAAKRSFYAMPAEYRQLLQAVAESPRFGGVKASCFVENPAGQGVAGFPALPEEAAIEQFAAVTMTYVQKGESIHYIAFRATDGSADGWTEDLLMLASRCTQSQEDSKNYMNIVGSRLAGPLCGGGHSKGGNNFEYGYLFCDQAIRDRMQTGYLYDSPGLYRGVLDGTPYERFQQVIRGHFLCPQDAIIGLLLHENQNASFIYSVESGLDEHDPYSWEVDPATGDFRPAEQTAFSKYINDALDRSVNQMTAAEREALYSFAYYIMQNYGDTDCTGKPLEGDVGKIVRLFTHGWYTEDGRLRLDKFKEIWQVFADDWNSMPEEKQAFFLESLGCLLTAFAAVSAEYAWAAAENWVEEKKMQLRTALETAMRNLDRWVGQKEEACKGILLSVYDAFEAQLCRFFGLGCQQAPDEPSSGELSYNEGSAEDSENRLAAAPAAPAFQRQSGKERGEETITAPIDLRRYASRLKRVSRTLSALEVKMDSIFGASMERPESLLTYSWRVSQCANWLCETAGQQEMAGYQELAAYDERGTAE